jgi:hypothetical protein
MINRLMMRGFGPSGYPTGPAIEKVPGEDEYVFAPRGTNNPEGARQQQIDGHLEAQKNAPGGNNALIRDVDSLIMQLRDAKDQAIMIDYYCNGFGIRRSPGSTTSTAPPSGSAGMGQSVNWRRSFTFRNAAQLENCLLC